MEELIELLDLSNVKSGCYSDYFSKIADIMLNDIAIEKGDSIYRITDIEFYYHCNIRGHESDDPVTYARNTEKGVFFFHDSGMDLCFKSTCTPADKSVPNAYKMADESKDFAMGGILLRGIKCVSSSSNPEKVNESFDGPQKVTWELVDMFDAFDSNNSKYLPHIINYKGKFDAKSKNIVKRVRIPNTFSKEVCERKWRYYIK